jgi:hypothetical protein
MMLDRVTFVIIAMTIYSKSWMMFRNSILRQNSLFRKVYSSKVAVYGGFGKIRTEEVNI